MIIIIQYMMLLLNEFKKGRASVLDEYLFFMYVHQFYGNGLTNLDSLNC